MTPGTRLCHFEILEPLGAGGMGEVYRAQDTHLRREVAIKLLPQELSSDPERLARLQREAQLLAALNHPNVAAIHSLEQEGSTRFLVMELVEGETVAEHLQRGPLPVELALRIAGDIARALEAAHEAGIIHRDLKPANVKITPDMKVKVLDFGLAKAADSGLGPESGDLSHSPTLMGAPTGTGVIIGTAAYMSPEQARGRPLDKRTDIWSFGVLLFEMLTGRRPFAGGDLSDTIAAILRDEPDWRLLPATTPPLARALLRRCLRRDPERRLHDIADARIEIEEALDETGEADAVLMGTATRPAPRPRWIQAAPWAVAAFAAAAAVGLGVWPQGPAADLPVSRLSLDTGPLALGAQPNSSILALSPDGSMIAFVSGRADVGQIYLQPLDSYDPDVVEEAEMASTPFFSPDGQWLGFWADGWLRKVPVEGGKALPICEVAYVDGAVWSEDDTIIYGVWETMDLRRMSADGVGVPKETIVRADPSENEWFVGYPQMLPNGEDVLFTVFDNAHFAKRVELVNLQSGDRTGVMQGGSNLRYLSTGHLLYAVDGSLMAVTFDPDLRKVTGDPRSVADDLLMGFLVDPNFAHFSVSDTGTLAYVSGPTTNMRRLLRVDRTGKETSIPGQLRGVHGPRFSPDGGRIAVAGWADGMSLWVYDLERDMPPTRMTLEGKAWWPVWTPDGQRLAFTRFDTSEGLWNIFWTLADDSGSPERLIRSPDLQTPSDWSSDGKTLILQRSLFQPSFSPDVLEFRPGEDDEARPILSSSYMELLADLSPDGRWLAYTSDETGRFEVFVRSFPDLGDKQQISTEGGVEPVWSPDGAELFYRSEEGSRLMVVDVVVEPEFSAGASRLLFEGDYAATWFTARYYDVAPDGQSFVLVQGDAAARAEAQVRVVLNWTEELKRLVPTER